MSVQQLVNDARGMPTFHEALMALQAAIEEARQLGAQRVAASITNVYNEIAGMTAQRDASGFVERMQALSGTPACDDRAAGVCTRDSALTPQARQLLEQLQFSLDQFAPLETRVDPGRDQAISEYIDSTRIEIPVAVGGAGLLLIIGLLYFLGRR